MGLRFGGLAAALLLIAAPAAGAAPLRTEAIAVTPPDGWVVGSYSFGAIELGEFRPRDKTGDGYADLLDYFVKPVGVDAPSTQAEIPAYERRTQGEGCRQSVRRDVQHRAGWYADQSLCLGLDPAEPDKVELEFAVGRVGAEAFYRMWRSWTGSPEGLTAMIKARTGRDLAPVVGKGAAKHIDTAALDAAIAALLPVFGKDLDRSEICDLQAPGGCRAFKDTLPKEATERLRGAFIAGLYAKGLGLLSRDEFRRRFNIRAPDDGTPNQAFVILEPGDLDWGDPGTLRRVAQLIGGGQGADGGSLVLSDPKGDLPPAERAQLRARLLMIGRALWREGYPPDIIAFRIPAAD